MMPWPLNGNQDHLPQKSWRHVYPLQPIDCNEYIIHTDDDTEETLGGDAGMRFELRSAEVHLLQSECV